MNNQKELFILFFIIDYYFSKDGKSGYLEMDVNGKKMKQQWSG